LNIIDPDSDSFISLELLALNEDELAIAEFENRKITKRIGAININLKWVEVIVILSRSNKVFISLSLNEITMKFISTKYKQRMNYLKQSNSSCIRLI
jgi:hypothetical protein